MSTFSRHSSISAGQVLKSSTKPLQILQFRPDIKKIFYWEFNSISTVVSILQSARFLFPLKWLLFLLTTQAKHYSTIYVHKDGKSKPLNDTRNYGLAPKQWWMHVYHPVWKHSDLCSIFAMLVYTPVAVADG